MALNLCCRQLIELELRSQLLMYKYSLVGRMHIVKLGSTL